jgi:excisionase family DNA binding protein
MKTKINELSKAAGIMTAYQLQKKTDLSPSQAARLYRDEVEGISISVLEKLCDALQTSPNDIFGYSEPQTVKRPSVPDVAKKAATESQTLQESTSAKGMTTVEAATRLGVSRKSVNDYIVSGKLKAAKGKGNHNLISEADLQEFINNR